MSHELESISFVLCHNDISISDVYGNYPLSNDKGYIDSPRLAATWYNVDFGEMLRDYPDYEYFNLQLSGVLTQYAAVFPYANAAQQVNTYTISGLDFIRSSCYDARTRSFTNTAYMASLLEASGSHFTFMAGTVLTFRRPTNPKASITITIGKVDYTTLQMAANTLHPRCSFFFSIFPVE